jgi:small-conductance mechanosensitive channel
MKRKIKINFKTGKEKTFETPYSARIRDQFLKIYSGEEVDKGISKCVVSINIDEIRQYSVEILEYNNEDREKRKKAIKEATKHNNRIAIPIPFPKQMSKNSKKQKDKKENKNKKEKKDKNSFYV